MSRSTTLWFLLASLLTAPLAAQVQPSLDNVTGDIRIAQTTGVQTVIVTNQSDYPIIVNDVTLKTCVNTRGICGVRRTKVRVAQHAQAEVLKLVPIVAKKEMTYLYSFSFKLEDPKSSTAIAAAKRADSVQKANAAAANKKLEQLLKVAAAKGALSEEDYDSLVALPPKLEVSVGETVDLTSTIVLHARSASGKEINVPRVQVLLASGNDVLALDGGTVRGLKAGTATLMFSLGISTDTTATGKGIIRVPVTVVP